MSVAGWQRVDVVRMWHIGRAVGYTTTEDFYLDEKFGYHFKNIKKSKKNLIPTEGGPERSLHIFIAPSIRGTCCTMPTQYVNVASF